MENQNLSASTACANCFFRHFPKDMIWSYFSYFEMARLDNIFKAAGVCIEKTCSQTIWLICFYFCTPWNTWVYSIMPTQTNTFTSPVQPASRVSQKINWFGWIKVWNVSNPIHWVTHPQKESLFSSTPKNFQCTKRISKKCFFTAAASKRPNAFYWIAGRFILD